MSLNDPRIRDIPSFSKTLRQAEQFERVRRWLPLFGPILKLIGIDARELRKILGDLPELRADLEELAQTPDRFNDLFSSRGWIMHGDMKLSAAQKAISLAEERGLDTAEEYLVEYYAPDEVEWMLRRMHSIEAFRPRMRLAQLALRDYREGRYHACIPVVLAQLDGTVSQVDKRRRGFFAEDADMRAWDSIAGHATGLNVLAEMFQKGRRSLNEDPISIPYRHGILHGWDVNYDSELVAAKSWAALFAIRDWATKAEREGLEEPEPEKEPSFREIVDRMRENEATLNRLDAWEARDITIGEDIPSHGAPEDYPQLTPERAVVEYLGYWKERNYGYMAKYLELPFVQIEDPEIHPGRIREELCDRDLESFEILSVTDEVPAASDVEVKLALRREDDVKEVIKSFRVVFSDRHGQALVRGDPKGRWSIINWYV